MNKVFYFTVRKLSYNNFKEFRRYRINSSLKTKILMGKQSIKPERKAWMPFNDKSCLCGNPKNKCNLDNECSIRNKRED
jgi:hypothetical protein